MASSAPIALRAAIATSATSASSATSGSAERRPSARAAAGSNPVAVQRGPIAHVAAITAALAAAAHATSEPSTTSRLPNSSVSTLEPE